MWLLGMVLLKSDSSQQAQSTVWSSAGTAQGSRSCHAGLVSGVN